MIRGTLAEIREYAIPGHRPALSCQQKAVRQIGKPASKQCASNNILKAMFVFSISQLKHRERHRNFVQ